MLSATPLRRGAQRAPAGSLGRPAADPGPRRDQWGTRQRPRRYFPAPPCSRGNTGHPVRPQQEPMHAPWPRECVPGVKRPPRDRSTQSKPGRKKHGRTWHPMVTAVGGRVEIKPAVKDAEVGVGVETLNEGRNSRGGGIGWGQEVLLTIWIDTSQWRTLRGRPA